MSEPNEEVIDPTLALHRQTEARLKEIEIETKKQPLTSDLCKISDLKAQYADSNDGNSGNSSSSSNFLAGVVSLEKEYNAIRMIRGDGNCYYRAFLYSLIEHMMKEDGEEEAARIIDFFKNKSWKDVLAQGYDEMALEIFYDSIVDLLERVVVTKKLDVNTFHKEMNEENATSDYCTWYLRVLTATHLKQDPDRFLPFLLDAQQSTTGGEMVLDINQFCLKFIEPMGQECEQVQVLALAETVGVKVSIEYLDGRDLTNGKLTKHQFGPDHAKTNLTFLYRPGHYDILYV